jgi:hypothetical protein
MTFPRKKIYITAAFRLQHQTTKGVLQFCTQIQSCEPKACIEGVGELLHSFLTMALDGN